ncbi:class A beta-lactamase [Methylophaga sulfidovorans]|uniref:Beta-lactamase n=1 Tax=Methylophaga sulfidovorans TaxID=45496 RepID=A0A1I3ZI98_9GAMM|nr:class A beta-lactamase [Methylophaga sulfidovorans]SFK43401.1 beta-lactamase class A [Methylophaga sulfidovorans]
MKSLLKLLTLFFIVFTAQSPAFAVDANAAWQDDVAQLETVYGGRIGVSAWNTNDGQQLQYRENERFAMCSTFKLLLVANVLHRIDQKQEKLDRLISYDKSDILDYAPVTSQHLDKGAMTVAALSKATLQLSDNTAANLLLNTLGGPQGLTSYLRTLGDDTTRLDRIEPNLNSNLADDPRDTTTPEAMLFTLKTILLGDALSESSKQRLIHWLIGNQTGDDKIRAGVPSTWLVGDKTGSGANGANNDVAIIWPDAGQPYLLVVYYSGSERSKSEKNMVIEKISQSVSKAFSPE